jgi:hypothetical protein
MSDLKCIDLKLDDDVTNDIFIELKKNQDYKFKLLIQDTSMNLTEKEIEILLLIIEKKKQLLIDLINLVDVIKKDNLIDSQDIHYLIVFMKDLYCFIHSFKKDIKVNSSDIRKMLPNLVKFIINFIFERHSTIVPIKDLFLLENIINSSVEILNLTSSLKIKKCNLNNLLPSLKKNV